MHILLHLRRRWGQAQAAHKGWQSWAGGPRTLRTRPAAARRGGRVQQLWGGDSVRGCGGGGKGFACLACVQGCL